MGLLLSVIYPLTVTVSKVKEVTPDTAADFLEKFDTILLDCDGVVWKTDHFSPIPGTGRTIEELTSLGKRVIFVSNNSMHCRAEFLKKFQAHGIATSMENIFCVAYACAIFLKKVKGVTSSVYVMGNQGLQDELVALGVDGFGAGPDPTPTYCNAEQLKKLEYRDNVGAVLVGYDESINLNKLCKASSYLSRSECAFYATDYEQKSVFISPYRVPIAGCFVDAVKSATRRTPEVIGKPAGQMFNCIVAAHPDIDISRTIMIGDTLEVDIGFAKTAGISSALVLTGMSSLQDMHKAPDHLRPDYVMESLTVLGGGVANTSKGK